MTPKADLFALAAANPAAYRPDAAIGAEVYVLESLTGGYRGPARVTGHRHMPGVVAERLDGSGLDTIAVAYLLVGSADEPATPRPEVGQRVLVLASQAGDGVIVGCVGIVRHVPEPEACGRFHEIDDPWRHPGAILIDFNPGLPHLGGWVRSALTTKWALLPPAAGPSEPRVMDRLHTRRLAAGAAELAHAPEVVTADIRLPTGAYGSAERIRSVVGSPLPARILRLDRDGLLEEIRALRAVIALGSNGITRTELLATRKERNDALSALATERTAVEMLTAERDRFREHSTTLNTVAWRLASALGDVPDGATEVDADAVGLAERLIAERDRYRTALRRVADGRIYATGEDGAALAANSRRTTARQALDETQPAPPHREAPR